MSASDHSQRAPLAARNTVLTLGASIIGISLLLFAALVEANRQSARADAQVVARNLSALLAEHVGRVMDVSDMAAIQAVSLADGRNWEQVGASQEAFASLLRLAYASRNVSAIWLVDSAGLVRLTTRGFPTPELAVGDRPSFLAQKDHDVGPFLSAPARNGATKESNLIMSRRINTAGGGFGGVAMVSLDTAYFDRLFAEVQARFPVTIELFRDDLAVMARWPDGKNGQPANKSTISPSQLREAPFRGLVEENDLEAGKVEAYQRVAHFPLYVSAAVAHADVTRVWLKESLRQAVFAACALGFQLLLVGIAAVRAGREAATREEAERLAETLEDRVRDRTAIIEGLLSEMNHRVKNSLQTISGLLHMHARTVKDPTVRLELHEARNRVQTVARVHERIYRAEGTPTVRFDELLQRLCDDLSPTLTTVTGAAIGLTVTADALDVPVDKAEPISLMVSEMVGNAVKHAFPDAREGHIWVRLARLDDERAELSVTDNGRGFPDGFSPHRTSGLGMQLMLGFANQIGGALTCGAPAEGQGARCSIVFSTRPTRPPA